MNHIYNNILHAIKKEERLLAVLIDPDKMKLIQTSEFMCKVNQSIATHIFVGGSTVEEQKTDILISEIKTHTDLPVVIFPGDSAQITGNSDALLFLSLISGRNPDYLIGKQIEAVPILRNIDIEVIATGYLLIENGKETSVEKVSKTKPMKTANIQSIIDTAIAGEFLGMKLIYLEAGSGAKNPVNAKIIKSVKKELNIPLIVGGGIKSKEQLENAYNAGADLVVIGTAFENDTSFFNELV